ncbi:uncharacterized protein Z518_00434 [Rhinocladiella mackenziei CBS 650.93]|uniref:Major facilitator superfamily (MFS) profile domain-containing protein n=1 Tax=Rhinocladiella mackenziei CBS 650.93 TaxID=1442369 RepID=A0A0D2JIV6_9EURO|nr:uncharacterized protein Z518_00434 [Rhinocladiella mackenziei CBS 650.93]KIX09355.1 hypothetical protein Z518_00434 [Rhinocladiella mackenziei CBS 650.93]
MGSELRLQGNAYNILLLVFFPFYIAFQAPMVVIARKLRPRRFITGVVTSWGIVMIGMGMVETWQAMIPLRCLLGVFEAGYFSTVAYLLSAWYIRRILTAVLGVSAYLVLVDFPEDAAKSWRFLNEEEVQLVVNRINRDRHDVQLTPFNLRWFFALNMCMTSVVNYTVGYFLPIVLRDGLGFSVAAAQCLNTPCYVFAFLLGISQSWFSDRINLRAPLFLMNCVLEIVGICLLGFAKPNGARYFGAMLITGGAYANNIVGQWKRAFCSTMLVGASGIGGIIGSLVFRSQDTPNYRPGLYSCLTAAFLCILSMLTTTAYFCSQNKKQSEGKAIVEGEEGCRYTY